MFRNGLQSERENSLRSNSDDVPLNDRELQRLTNAIIPAGHGHGLTEKEILQVRAVLSDYFSRTGVKLSKPPHVHIEREDKIAKFWLDPIRLQQSGGFSRIEIGQVQKIITDHHSRLMEAWNEYFRG